MRDEVRTSANSGALVLFICSFVLRLLNSSALVLFIYSFRPRLLDSEALMLFICSFVLRLLDSGALMLFICSHWAASDLRTFMTAQSIQFFTHICSACLTAAQCIRFLAHIWSTCLTEAVFRFFTYIYSTHLRASALHPNFVLPLSTTDAYYDYCTVQKCPAVSMHGVLVLHSCAVFLCINVQRDGYKVRMSKRETKQWSNKHIAFPLQTNTNNLAQTAASPPTYTLHS